MQSKKNILLHDYGGYMFTYQLAQALACDGHAVAYLYSRSTQFIQRNNGDCKDEAPGQLVVEGIELSAPFRKYNYFARRAQEMEHGRLVAQRIVSLQPDIVISANTPLDAQRTIQKASRAVNARFIFWLQDAIGIATGKILSQKIPVLGQIIGSYYCELEQKMLHASDEVILIDEEFHRLMKKWRIQSDKTHVIPNWAVLDQITPMNKDNEWARVHDLHDKFVFLYSGILGLKHNPAIFLHLANEYRFQKEVRVVVVAEGPGAEFLLKEKQSQGLDNLMVLPYQSYQDFPCVLAAADVLVAALGEDAGAYSVPSKVLSYLCAKRPILLSVPKENLAARIIEENQAGIAASPADPQAFLHASKALYLNQTNRSGYAENGYGYAHNNFEIQKILKRFEAIF